MPPVPALHTAAVKAFGWLGCTRGKAKMTYTLKPASLCAISLVEAVQTMAKEFPRGRMASNSPEASHCREQTLQKQVMVLVRQVSLLLTQPEALLYRTAFRRAGTLLLASLYDSTAYHVCQRHGLDAADHSHSCQLLILSCGDQLTSNVPCLLILPKSCLAGSS